MIHSNYLCVSSIQVFLLTFVHKWVFIDELSTNFVMWKLKPEIIHFKHQILFLTILSTVIMRFCWLYKNIQTPLLFSVWSIHPFSVIYLYTPSSVIFRYTPSSVVFRYIPFVLSYLSIHPFLSYFSIHPFLSCLPIDPFCSQLSIHPFCSQ